MELRQLRYFVALADCLSFTAAAEQVHVTQPTLSQQIKQLETELGTPLFERNQRRVNLTTEGMLFLPKVLDALKLLDDGTALLKEVMADLSGHVRIAASQTFNIAIVPRTVLLFKEHHKDVRITIEELTLADMMAALRRRQIDMAVAYRPVEDNDFTFEPLCEEELVLIVPPDHPLARRKRVRMVELHGRDIVMLPERFMTRKILNESFHAAGTQPNVIIESGTIPSLLQLVKLTGAPTILSRFAIPSDSELKPVPLESPRPMRTTGLIWAKDRLRTPSEAAFAALLRRVTNSYIPK